MVAIRPIIAVREAFRRIERRVPVTTNRMPTDSATGPDLATTLRAVIPPPPILTSTTAGVAQPVIPARMRQILIRSSGRRHGSITRLVSPSDIGELIKPFVFLDYAELKFTGRPLFGIHPHSGIATLTIVLGGGFEYEDTTGKSGQVTEHGLEWMKAGNGVWHDGTPLEGPPLRLFQLWLALPAAEENAPPESQYVPAGDIECHGPVRVVLGQHGQARSPIRSDAGVNYFHVHLSAGEHWRYEPPLGHNVAWLAVDRGRLLASEPIDAGQLAVFEEGGDAIDVVAESETSFVLGSAIKHPHPLVLGNYSVHTSEETLAQGEAEIARIGRQLYESGRL
jgi:redox-sensitive bicupin YhaK (pirin superfamily)